MFIIIQVTVVKRGQKRHVRTFELHHVLRRWLNQLGTKVVPTLHVLLSRCHLLAKRGHYQKDLTGMQVSLCEVFQSVCPP